MPYGMFCDHVGRMDSVRAQNQLALINAEMIAAGRKVKNPEQELRDIQKRIHGDGWTPPQPRRMPFHLFMAGAGIPIVVEE